jgi:malonyl CoA-acyl carrier protein transacylase
MHMSLMGIYRASEASADMESLDEGLLVAGVGLHGERYARHVGTYSVLRISQSHPGEREPGRQLTLLSADSVRERLKEANLSLHPTSSLGNLRRNLVVTGVSAEQLMNGAGRIVQKDMPSAHPSPLRARSVQ